MASPQGVKAKRTAVFGMNSRTAGAMPAIADVYKRQVDSSANVYELPDVGFACVPLKILTDEQEYVDTAEVDAPALAQICLLYTSPAGFMVQYLSIHKDVSDSACCVVRHTDAGPVRWARCEPVSYTHLPASSKLRCCTRVGMSGQRAAKASYTCCK